MWRSIASIFHCFRFFTRSPLHTVYVERQKCHRLVLQKQQKKSLKMDHWRYDDMLRLQSMYSMKCISKFPYLPSPFVSLFSIHRAICEYGLTLTYLMGNTVYMVLIATSFKVVMNYKLNVDWSVRYYIAAVAIPCLLLAQIRKLKYLVPFSIIANVSIVVTFAITLWYMFEGPLEIMKRPLFSSWSQLPLFFR